MHYWWPIILMVLIPVGLITFVTIFPDFDEKLINFKEQEAMQDKYLEDKEQRNLLQ